MTPAVTTEDSPEYRALRFESLDECVAEVQRIAAAAEAGRLTATGNWTPGEILTHLANWIQYAYVGFPIKRAPLLVRWFLRLRRGKILREGMPRGVRLPGVAGGTVGMEAMETAQAAERLLAALERLKSDEQAKFDSPGFGAMSHQERIALNLRHAELHLGYLHY